MQNIEFKAELRDMDLARAQCRALGASFVAEMDQVDTYYRMPDGRLKCRQTPGDPPEYIYYHRDNHAGPRRSNYMIYTEEQARTRWGMMSLKPWVTVVKTREIFMLDNVRIHLDQVQELGAFLEFEAVVSAKYSVTQCERRVRELRSTFAPILGEPIAESYSDLIARRADDQSD